MSTYTVQPGDTLPQMARTFLGDPGRWREIQLYNRALLVNPANLAPGMVLTLPPGAAIPVQPSARSSGGGITRAKPRAIARAGRRPPLNRR